MTKIQKTEMSSWREDRGTGRKKETDNRKTDRRRFFKADFFGKNDSEKENDRTDRDEENGGKAEKEAGILEPALKKELVILITLAVSVLLFCSNLGICGAFGRLLHKGMRGCFGLLGYAFPVCLFLAVCFLISNGGSRRAVIRVAVSFLGLVVLCGLLSLIALTSF